MIISVFDLSDERESSDFLAVPGGAKYACSWPTRYVKLSADD